MLISHYIEGLRGDLERLGRLAGEEFEQFAGRLAEAARPAIQARLLEALDLLVAEVNAGTDHQEFEVHIAGDEVSLRRGVSETDVPAAPGDLTARFALRLPEDLKAKIEELAEQAGASTNGWIVRSLSREADTRDRHESKKAGRTLRGTGRS